MSNSTESRPRSAPDRAALLQLAAISFLVMFAYAAARPVRDEIAANVDSTLRSHLWKGTFAVNLVLAPLYAWVASRSTRAGLLTSVFGFFAVTALGFALLASGAEDTVDGVASARLWAEATFYVWLSVFVMFVVSATWSLASELVETDTARSLFGPVAAATSAGGIVGAWTTERLSSAGIGAAPILFVVAGALVASCLLVFGIERLAARRGTNALGGAPIGGSVWSGLRSVVASRYLLGIAGFVLLMTMANAVFYFAQSDLVYALMDDRTERRAFLARIDLWVNVGALVCQLFLAGPAMRRLGIGPTLAALPLLAALGFVAIDQLAGRMTDDAAAAAALLPWLGVVLGAQRVGRYAFARPAREALYTLVTRDERYKSKSFIDTAVYRGGDVLWAEAYAIGARAGVSIGGLALGALPLVGAWLAGALWLGRAAERREREDAPEPVESA